MSFIYRLLTSKTYINFYSWQCYLKDVDPLLMLLLVLDLVMVFQLRINLVNLMEITLVTLDIPTHSTSTKGLTNQESVDFSLT